MKKFWSYIAVGLAFFSAGLITMYKLMGDQISITIKKIKNKGTSGDQQLSIPIEVRKPRKQKKKRQET